MKFDSSSPISFGEIASPNAQAGGKLAFPVGNATCMAHMLGCEVSQPNYIERESTDLHKHRIRQDFSIPTFPARPYNGCAATHRPGGGGCWPIVVSQRKEVIVPISVEIQDESGHRDGDPWSHPRSTKLLCRPDQASVCLRFIDPYGNTTFNQSQLPVLLAELAALADATPDSADKEIIRDLQRFLRTALGEVHTYVQFIGD